MNVPPQTSTSTSLGFTEAIIDTDCGISRFYQVARILSDDFQINFSHKEDDFYAINWNFQLESCWLTLHYNIYNGISLHPSRRSEARGRENKIVLELAGMLQERLMKQTG